MSVEEVLVHTRLAADAVGATKMDRCEDVQPSLRTGKVYVVCTNNTDRGKVGKEGPTEPNPRNANKHGHIVEITERGGQTSTPFAWNLVLVAGDPAAPDTYFAGFPKDKVSPISCPDNIAFDSADNLWIATDGMPSAIGLADGLFRMPLPLPSAGTSSSSSPSRRTPRPAARSSTTRTVSSSSRSSTRARRGRGRRSAPSSPTT